MIFKQRCIKTLALCWGISICLGLSLQAQTLHAILVADVQDYDIGESAEKAFNFIQMKMEVIAKNTGMKFNPRRCYKDAFGKAKLLKEIKSLYTNEEDVIFFFSVTHGFRYTDQQDKFPTLYLGNKDKGDKPDVVGLELRRIDSLLKQKAARLKIVVAEACNVVLPNFKTPKSENLNKQKPMPGPGYARAVNYRKLFLKARGSLMVSSCEKEQVSWITPKGGFFSNAFFRNLDVVLASSADMSSARMWQVLLENTQKETLEISNNTKDTKKQIPQFSGVINETWIRSKTIQVDENFRQQAIEMWKKAAALGNTVAKKRLEEYYKKKYNEETSGKPNKKFND